MKNILRVRIRGDYACFTRPEFKGERVSYELITPSAARGILEAILWKPAIRWHIRRIALLKPVRFVSIKRNEVNSRISTRNAIAAMREGQSINYYADQDRAQRNTLALRDVDYAIDASIGLTSQAGPDETLTKFEEMFLRRLRKGQCHHQPCLGFREFPAIVEEYAGNPKPIETETRTLGLMLHDFDHNRDRQARFFSAALYRGVIEVPEWKAA